jgi:hypothetical protein
MAPTLTERLGPSGYVPFPTDVVMEDRTGQPPISTEILAIEGALPVFQRQGALADPGLRSALVGVLGSQGEPGGSITSYGTVLVMEVPAWATLVSPSDPSALPMLVIRATRATPVAPVAPSQRVPRRARPPATVITPAEELRSLTGLAPGMLADLFGVSRTTFYKWIEGATPRDERFQHLVDVVTHVRDARQRLPSSVDFAAWLRTPISPGAKTPLEYLREARFSVFRGLVLRAASAGLAQTVASTIPSRPMSRSERAIARERISPTPRVEDDEG